MEVISVENLYKTYPGEIEAVKGLNLTINQGEIYGFLGPNGAGKSTTIQMLTGLLKPTSGQINMLDGIMPKDFKELSGKLGYVPQDLIFYNHLTVYENLKLFGVCLELEDLKYRILELMKLLQIDSLASRRARDLSGGQKRRLNLAIGLLHDPDILILDEPSAGMDPQSRNILWETIKSIANKKQVTIILTTHLMETVDRLADRIGIIDNGNIIAEGTPLELKNLYGKGDVLEVSFKEDDPKKLEMLKDVILKQYPEAKLLLKEEKLRCTLQNLMQEFSNLNQLIEKTMEKTNIRSMTVHENTLEDVFIDLTGRELRE